MSFLKKMFGGDQADTSEGAPVNTRDPDVMIDRLMALHPGDSQPVGFQVQPRYDTPAASHRR